MEGPEQTPSHLLRMLERLRSIGRSRMRERRLTKHCLYGAREL